jgi:hypothetical protein
MPQLEQSLQFLELRTKILENLERFVFFNLGRLQEAQRSRPSAPCVNFLLFESAIALTDRRVEIHFCFDLIYTISPRNVSRCYDVNHPVICNLKLLFCATVVV